MPEQPADWLSPQAVSVEYGLGLDLLQNHRSAGTGAPYVKLGSRTVRYHRPAFTTWLTSLGQRAPGSSASTPSTPPSPDPSSCASIGSVREQIARLEPLVQTARSLAALTPSGVANVAGLALADNLERDLTWLRSLAANVEGA